MAWRSTKALAVAEAVPQWRSTRAVAVSSRSTLWRSTKARATAGVVPQWRSTKASATVELNPNAPLLFLARSELTAPAGCPVELTAVAIPTSPAVITAWTWRILSKTAGMPAAILTGASSPVAIFRGRPSRKDGTYTIGVTAVDNDGLRSPELSVAITVTAADMMSAMPTGWVPSTVEWCGEKVKLDYNW
jgi:hypothetical protein